MQPSPLSDAAQKRCRQGWEGRGFVSLADLFAAAALEGSAVGVAARARALCLRFNASAGALGAIRRAAEADGDAANLAAWMARHGLDRLPATPLPSTLGARLLRRFEADPEGYLAAAAEPYPFRDGQQYWGFDPAWVARALADARDRLADFAAGRGSDTAVLLGNGPSLARVDLDDLRGQDVFISNYAIRHPVLGALARGVAVTNILVAAQEPFAFDQGPLWKFHPLWLGHVLHQTDRTVWLNAMGGPAFFSTDITRRIAWHATVSFFWLQVLYHAGYRRVVLTGFDNSYVQPEGLREGDPVRQEGDDPNHFDPAYFRGKVWQAADTDHMAEVLGLAGQAYAADGREIINSTVGGALEVFPRRPLREALGL